MYISTPSLSHFRLVIFYVVSSHVWHGYRVEQQWMSLTCTPCWVFPLFKVFQILVSCVVRGSCCFRITVIAETFPYFKPQADTIQALFPLPYEVWRIRGGGENMEQAIPTLGNRLISKTCLLLNRRNTHHLVCQLLLNQATKWAELIQA